MPRISPALFLLPLFMAASCQFSEHSAESTPCRSDIECPQNMSCDPWKRICVTTTARVPRDVELADRDQGAEAPRCPRAGAACDDGDPCTSGDVCSEQLLCAGAAYSCDDGFACTLDQCDGQGACNYLVAAGTCLIEGECRDQGTSKPTLACLACIPAVSTTVWTPVGGSCDDGDACTIDDFCDLGVCKPGTAASCDDGNPCTADTCKPGEGDGCIHTPNDGLCDDGVSCTADTCDVETGCVSEPKNEACHDGNSCTQDTCDPVEGCTNLDEPKLCDDGIECTQDSCDPAAGCANEPDDDACDDDDPTTADVCDVETGCVNTPL